MGRLLYKVLADDGSAIHGGKGRWPLPDDSRPGAWIELPAEQTIEPYGRGLHLCRRQDLVHWLGPAIFEAEYDGELLDAGELIVRKARLLRKLDAWNERSARLFAADCAEHALERCDEGIDPRSYQAIEVARRFAEGEIDRPALAEAYGAAYVAAEKSGAAAAYAATFCTGRSAFWAASRTASYAGDWEWQTERLFGYLEQ